MSIILASAVSPILLQVVVIALILLVVGFVLKIFHQPYIVAYIICGILLGPSGLSIISDGELITNLGSIGLVLLLFFIGMEFSLADLIGNWKISVVGALMQVGISVMLIYLIGSYLDWGWTRILLFGFVITLSSTAVVFKLLEETGEIHTPMGQTVAGILLTQDILIVPMLIVIGFLGDEPISTSIMIKQLIGLVLISIWVIWILRKKNIELPFEAAIERDHELQVFVSLVVCLGFAAFTGILELSTALGAFLGGIFVSSLKATRWFHDSLHSFRVIFVALFFLSVGLLLDIEFMIANIKIILGLVVLVLLTNHGINTLIMRIFGRDLKESIYAGAILAQVGEFSFVLGATAFMGNIIDEFAYQIIVSVISLSLIISPLWILITKSVLHRPPSLSS